MARERDKAGSRVHVFLYWSCERGWDVEFGNFCEVFQNPLHLSQPFPEFMFPLLRILQSVAEFMPQTAQIVHNMLFPLSQSVPDFMLQIVWSSQFSYVAFVSSFYWNIVNIARVSLSDSVRCQTRSVTVAIRGDFKHKRTHWGMPPRFPTKWMFTTRFPRNLWAYRSVALSNSNIRARPRKHFAHRPPHLSIQGCWYPGQILPTRVEK